MEKMDNQIKTLRGTLSEIQAMKRTAIGNYKRTMRALENAKSAMNSLGKSRPAINDVMDINNTRGASDGGNNNAFQDAKDFLAKIFADPRVGAPSQAILNLRYNVRQKSFKNTLDKSEKIMSSEKERLNNLEDLAAAIDKTVNLKDAADLSNRFLFEIVRLNMEMLTVVVSLAESYSIKNYNGVSKNAISETTKRYKAAAAHRTKVKLVDQPFYKSLVKEAGGVTFKQLLAR